MRAQALNSITGAAEVFADARRQLQAAIDAANDLGLAIPDSFPDAIDHLQDWTTSADAEARDLLQLLVPSTSSQLARRQAPRRAARSDPRSPLARPTDGGWPRDTGADPDRLPAASGEGLPFLPSRCARWRATRLHGRAGRQGHPRTASA